MDSRQTEPDIKSCGVLIFRQQPDLSFLLMKHADRWDLPKGHVDHGETDLETALRELEEETGISADQIQLDDEFRFSQIYEVRKKRYGNEPKMKELVVFLAELHTDHADFILTLTEHIGYEWFDWDPPHDIQEKSINPLLNTVEEYWGNKQ